MNKRKIFVERFIEFNAHKRMASGKKHVLLAVSGGIDSVVMCELFYKAGFPFSIAHCNFQLRGKEADADEEFVIALATKYKVPVFTKKFDTTAYASVNGVSIQVAARELRYKWFEELFVAAQDSKRGRIDLIATAHHLNDNIETIIFNLVKGTGIRGLRGIPVRNGNVIRPLLFASREEINNFAKQNSLAFREDSSNKTDKYSRNYIRHHVIPLLKEINPSLEKTMGEKIELFGELENLYVQQNKKLNRQLFLPRGDDIYIPLLKLKRIQNSASVLFEFLKDFDFTSAQVEDMLDVIDESPGRQFLTSKARIIKDRKFFILTKLSENNFTAAHVYDGDTEVGFAGRRLAINQLHKSEISESKLTAEVQTVYLDKSHLSFPLTLRKWKAGDYFYPFGMGMKKKKLKKFLTDEKVPLHEKENIWVIESDQRIVWVVGYRLDERFKIKHSTTEVLKIKLV